MAKIMLVEDDNNLREIYGARLLAEGHEIVAAKDGEEALATAVKEKPDLIISDVMMPRISGFDMLDILRNAPETKETKVIMMTALSQAEDKARADNLGADRYLVKSQVTLEDVAKVVRDVLDGKPAPSSDAPAAQAPEASVAPPVEPVAPAPAVPEVVAEPPATPAPAVSDDPVADPAPAAEAEAPVIPEPPAAEPTQIKVELPPEAKEAEEPVIVEAAPVVQPVEESTSSEVHPTLAEALQQEQDSASANNGSEPNSEPIAPETPEPSVVNGATTPGVITPTEEKPAEPAPAEAPAEPEPAPAPKTEEPDEETTKKKVIQPLHDPEPKPDLNALMEAEQQKAAVVNPGVNSVITPEGADTPAPETAAASSEPKDEHDQIAI